MLAIFLLLFCWGLAAIALGLLAFFVALVINEAWQKILLGRSYKDD